MATVVQKLTQVSDNGACHAGNSDPTPVDVPAEEIREEGIETQVAEGELEGDVFPCSTEPARATLGLTAGGARQLSDDSGAPAVPSVEDRGELVTSDNQMSPTFNVETSTTDSGVSNASSVTSDVVGMGHLLVVNSEGGLLPNGEPATLHVSSTSTDDEMDQASASQFVLGDPSVNDRATGWLEALDLECGATGDRLNLNRFEGSAVPPRSVSAGGTFNSYTVHPCPQNTCTFYNMLLLIELHVGRCAVCGVVCGRAELL